MALVVFSKLPNCARHISIESERCSDVESVENAVPATRRDYQLLMTAYVHMQGMAMLSMGSVTDARSVHEVRRNTAA